VPGRERWPEETYINVKAAVQAAWLANDIVLAREIVERYLDCTLPPTVCVRCAETFPPGAVRAYRVDGWGAFGLCPTCWEVGAYEFYHAVEQLLEVVPQKR
jgi:hypothetical protein